MILVLSSIFIGSAPAACVIKLLLWLLMVEQNKLECFVYGNFVRHNTIYARKAWGLLLKLASQGGPFGSLLPYLS